LSPVAAGEATEVGPRAATTDLSETETMVTTETAVAGSTEEEAMAAAVAGETVAVVEEAISRRTTPNLPAEKRTAQKLTHRESRILQQAKIQPDKLKC
jgi:hypothetical protein